MFSLPCPEGSTRSDHKQAVFSSQSISIQLVKVLLDDPVIHALFQALATVVVRSPLPDI